MIKISVISYSNEPPPQPLSIVVDNERITIGRGDDNTLVLPDPRRHVSRVQAAISWEQGAYILVNLSQSNPIFINGQEIGHEGRHPLQAGDELQIGLYILQATMAATATASAAPILPPIFAAIPEDHAPAIPVAFKPTAPLPDDFNLLNALSDVGRNSADPLADFSVNAISLESLQPTGKKEDLLASAAAMPANDLLDHAVGGVQSTSMDLLSLFDGPEVLPKTITPTAAPVSNHTSDLHAAFTLPQALPDPVAPTNFATPIAPRKDILPPLEEFLQPAQAITARPASPAFIPAAPIIAAPVVPAVMQTVTSTATPTATPPVAPLPLPVSAPAPTTDNAPIAANPTPAAIAANPPPPSPVSAQETASPIDHAALLQAFLRGADIPAETLGGSLTPERMETIGKLLAAATQGTVELMASRALVKREVKADVTMIVVQRNNPLKFLPDGQAALMQLLGRKMPGFMAPVEAMEDAYEDLRAHQIGVVAGMRAALAEVLKRFNPSKLENRFAERSFFDTVLPANRKAKLWDAYAELFQEIYLEAQDDFQTLFGKAFLAAYEAEIARFKEGIL